MIPPIVLGSTCLYQRQGHPTIYPSRPKGREHKRLSSLDTAPSRSYRATKGCKDTPALEPGRKQLHKKGPSSMVRMHFVAGMYKLIKARPIHELYIH